MAYQLFTGKALNELAASLSGGKNLFMPEGKKYWVDFVSKGNSPDRKSEMHDWETDVYIVVDGEADLYLGGTLVNPSSPREGQYRGDDLDGADMHHVTKGDVIVIPEGVPHMVDTRTSRLVWLVIKVDVGLK